MRRTSKRLNQVPIQCPLDKMVEAIVEPVYGLYFQLLRTKAVDPGLSGLERPHDSITDTKRRRHEGVRSNSPLTDCCKPTGPNHHESSRHARTPLPLQPSMQCGRFMREAH